MNLLSPSVILLICIGLALLATLLQLAALLAPMWFWLSKDGFYLGIGLWYVTGCYDNCTQTNPNFKTESNTYYENWHFNLIRAMETLGLIGGVVLCVWLILSRISLSSGKYTKFMRIGTLCVSFITTAFLIIGSLIFIAFYHSIMTESINFSESSFPWSFVMTLFATVIFFAICVLLLLGKDEVDTESNAPNVNKMALIPYSEKKHNLPLSYPEDRRSGAGTFNEGPRMGNGFSHKAYSSDAYDPYFRSNAYAEPPNKNFQSPYSDQELRRPASYASNSRNMLNKEPLYIHNNYVNYKGNELTRKKPSSEPIYSHYIEKPRLPSRIPSELKYTKEIRDGNSSSFMYKPYTPQRY